VQEDPGRNHYEPWELRVFDRIECEWPLFLCYEAINHLFEGESEEAEVVLEALERLAVPCEGLKLLPELYLVPRAGLARELAAPGSAEREAAGRLPFMWAQCLLTVARLLHEGLLAPAELDPMNRRLCAAKKPEALVQVVL
jgi:phosphorylase kinase alpha/beta subunit